MTHHLLPAGTDHLYGSFYAVPFESIRLPADNWEVEEDLKRPKHFKNPRFLTEKGQEAVLDTEDLRISIREHGLLNPPLCRFSSNEHVELCAGERRYRSISYLREKKEKVCNLQKPTWDAEKEKLVYPFESADRVYEKLFCMVVHAKDPVQALRLSHAENRCRKDFHDGQDVAMLIELRQYSGVSDKEIMQVLGCQLGWIRETDKLIAKLDEKILSALTEGRIKRNAVEDLAATDNLDARAQLLEIALQECQSDFVARVKRLHKATLLAQDRQDVAEGTLIHAEHRQDPVAIERAKERVAAAAEVVAERHRAEAEAKPIVKRSHVRQAAAGTSGKKVKKNFLRPPRVKKFYLDPLNAIIEAEGVLDEENEEVIEVGALQLCVKLIEGILDGEEDVKKLLKKHAQFV